MSWKKILKLEPSQSVEDMKEKLIQALGSQTIGRGWQQEMGMLRNKTPNRADNPKILEFWNRAGLGSMSIGRQNITALIIASNQAIDEVLNRSVGVRDHGIR